MSKAVLISVKPEWCDLILQGKKTIEVRKTVPKQVKAPFKVYIYCTKAKKGWLNLLTGEQLDGRVIGEFTCDHVYQYFSDYNACRPVDGTDITTEEMVRQSCLSAAKLYRYEYSAEPKEDCLYGWHISEFIRYDRPKYLREFFQCHKCQYYAFCIDSEQSCDGTFRLKRPPQSWCYVEEL